MRPRFWARTVAHTALLAALMIALGTLELLLPPVPFLPPGAKPGLGNIVILFALLRRKRLTAFSLVLLKALFAFLTRGAAAGFLSLCGGLLSLVLLLLLLCFQSKKLSLLLLCVASALCHNLGQLLACALLMRDTAVFWYFPALCLFGTVSGALTGAVTAAVLRRLPEP